MEPEESLPALKNRDLDVVVAYEWGLLPRLTDRGIEREKLLTEPVYLALPAGHRLANRGPVALADLRDEEWIVGRDSTSMLDLVIAATRRQGYEPRTDFHSMDFQVILSAVGAGLGVALVPPLALIGSYPNVEITRVSDLEIDRTIWAAVRKGSRGNPGIAAVLARAAAGRRRCRGPHPGAGRGTARRAGGLSQRRRSRRPPAPGDKLTAPFGHDGATPSTPEGAHGNPVRQHQGLRDPPRPQRGGAHRRGHQEPARMGHIRGGGRRREHGRHVRRRRGPG